MATARIQIVQVVQRPQRVKPRLTGHTALLPVEPPKVNAFGFQPMMHVKVRAHEIRICQVEFHRLFGRGINADPFGHLPVIIFKRTYTVSRMHIQRDFESAPVQIMQ